MSLIGIVVVFAFIILVLYLVQAPPRITQPVIVFLVLILLLIVLSMFFPLGSIRVVR